MTAENEIKFGTDGWRGIIARDFTFDNVRKTAQAIADYVISKNPKSKKAGGEALSSFRAGGSSVIVGYDRRFLSEKFALAVAQTLKANKIEVVLSDEVLPSPAVSLLTHKKFSLGVVITASHNHHSYNGIKIKFGGRVAPETVTAGIESHLGKTSVTNGNNLAIPRKSFKETYFKYIKSRLQTRQILSRLNRRVVLDCMYGCASGLIEEILHSKQIISIHTRHDPMFGGIQPEPVEKYLGELTKTVKQEKAVAGIALDGDADRIGMVDEAGRYMTPCQIFPMLLDYLLERGRLKGKIVQAVSLGYLAPRLAKANKLEFEEVPVGFKFIAEKMLSENVAMGAEESGGYAWKGNLPERDGLMTTLLILEMLTRTKKTPSQLYKTVEKKYGKSYFVRQDFKLAKPIADKSVFAERLRKKLPKTVLGRGIAEAKVIDGLKVILDNDHWLLIRPSGTEPLLRTYAETDSPSRTREFLGLARKWAGHYL